MASKEAIIAGSIEELTRAFREHLGPRATASSQFIPHTQLCAISRGAYTVTNPVTRRSFDPATVTLSELAEVVGTLITDLQAIKVLG